MRYAFATTVDGASRPPRYVFHLTLLLLVLCFLVAYLLSAADGLNEEGQRNLNVSLYLVASQDIIWLGMAIAFFPFCWVCARRKRSQVLFDFNTRTVIIITFGVFVTVWAGKFLVYHDFALSMDEFMMRWQSKLLQQGYLLAPAPDAWWPYSNALRPGFLILDEKYHFWAPGYRPGTAIIHALFAKLGLASAMNALLCAGSVWVVWLLARRELGHDRSAAIWAVILLATGPQFLVTGMAPYTMTAHLFASLLWIWLFTTDRPASHLLAILLGCYAMGLHHLHVHSFLVLPFLVHLLFVQKRYKLCLGYAIPYSIAALGWIFWMDIAVWVQGMSPVEQSPIQSVDGDLGLINQAVSVGLTQHGWNDLILWATNLTRFVAWQNLALFPLLFIAVRRFRNMPLTLRLLGWSAVISLIPYIILMPSQGHGWGYRYLHQVLGNLALIAAFGWSVANSRGWLQHMRFVTVIAFAGFLLGVPLRLVQTEAFVRPFAVTMETLQARPVDVVIVNSREMWYGNDLVRNDPLIGNSPVILAMAHLDPKRLAELCAKYTVSYEDSDTLRGTGMLQTAKPQEEVAQERARNLDLLKRAGCGK